MSTKITQEELKSLQEKLSGIRGLQSQIGTLEGQKHIFLHQLVNAQEDLQKEQIALEDKYGKITINIEDGSYEPIKEE